MEISAITINYDAGDAVQRQLFDLVEAVAFRPNGFTKKVAVRNHFPKMTAVQEVQLRRLGSPDQLQAILFSMAYSLHRYRGVRCFDLFEQPRHLA